MIHLSRSSLTVSALLFACVPLLLGETQSAANRTADGRPDFSGMWTNYDTTPFERLGPGEEFPRDLAVSTADWLVQNSPRSPRRPSMVVDPPNGRVPLKPEAIKARDAMFAQTSNLLERYGPWERCITRGVPASMMPSAYNNGHQIVQTRDFIVFHSEMIHEARVIPLDGRPHPGPAVTSWNGDSIGRWEGDTLVVDTTNFNGKGWIATHAAAGWLRGIPQSPLCHVVERLRRVDANTIHYEATIDDPNVYTRPWTVAFPLNRDDPYRIYEYACQEGNHALENMLRLGDLPNHPALDTVQTSAASVQYRSPEGVEYRSLPDTDAVRSARAALDADPRNVARIIDLGVAQSGARQVREAIATFTRGLEIEPNNALLLRWRGHRYLSVREFDRAFADLTRGAAIDSTIYGIWYHLGIVQYVRGDFASAAASFAKAQPIAPDAGELAGSTDWLWMSLSRAGRGVDAKAMLDRRPDSKPVSNAYTRRLQLYRGEIGADAVVTPADTDDVQVATLAYGLGNWYLTRGDKVQARRWFEKSIQSGGWPGFGFIVSEVELQRLR